MQLVEGRVEIDDLDAFLADLRATGDRHDCAIQAFDPRYVAGREHLERAVELANRSIERGENVADDRSIEILLYAAGRRQIDRALEMGVAAGAQDVVLVVDGGDETATVEALSDLVTDAAVLDGGDEATLRRFFDVTDAELAATTGTLADVVLERVALLDVEK